jgi:hypothetical protein
MLSGGYEPKFTWDQARDIGGYLSRVIGNWGSEESHCRFNGSEKEKGGGEQIRTLISAEGCQDAWE